MNNKEIIEDIKKHLTGINQVDIKYLNDQLKKYSKEKNDEVVYEIFTMIYKRLDPEALQKIHSQVESVQAKRIAEFTEAIKLYNNKEYAKSKEILLKLIDLFEKQFYMQKLNYYDFGEKIEGFIFCETPAKMDKMNIKFYPEPITRYLYYLAKIHHEENDDSSMIFTLDGIFISFNFSQCKNANLPIFSNDFGKLIYSKFVQPSKAEELMMVIVLGKTSSFIWS